VGDLSRSSYEIVHIDPVASVARHHSDTGDNTSGQPVPYALLLGRRRLSAARVHEELAEEIAGSEEQAWDERGDALADEFDGGDQTQSFPGGRPITLDDHLEGVGRVAASYAQACGLSTELQDDLYLAGRLHDLGKVDPRFQTLLRGGDDIAVATADEPLAKSGQNLRGAAYHAARRNAGYPQGARHELLSVALIQAVEKFRGQAHDWNLVLHLIASHHGKARPFAPPVMDDAPVEASHTVGDAHVAARSDHTLDALGSGIAERFHLLSERYGYYGLAHLEALLRLADHRRSQAEQQSPAEEDAA
jgi:CRISPR-associated endonuclease/helicase Cas3